jgi:hypothetical protein
MTDIPGASRYCPRGLDQVRAHECRIEPADPAEKQKSLQNFQRVRPPGSTQVTGVEIGRN